MQFFALPPCSDFTLDGEWLTYPSAVDTPHAENNLVRARYLPDHSPAGRKRAVIVLPQWNADADGHVGLCRLLNRFRISALRLSLPYHDERMPPELRRADYIVSSNVGRTAQVCRQAVLDARRGDRRGSPRRATSRIGILGTSLGSCLAMLTAAHEPPVAGRGAQPHLAVLRRRRVVGPLDRPRAAGARRPHRPRRACGASGCRSRPYPYLDRVRDKRAAARLRALRPDVPRRPVADARRRVPASRNAEHQLAVLPCGHYSTGLGPFKWLDGLTLCRFLSKNL